MEQDKGGAGGAGVQGQSPDAPRPVVNRNVRPLWADCQAWNIVDGTRENGLINQILEQIPIRNCFV